jgi:phosphate transport system substrate-binding protein
VSHKLLATVALAGVIALAGCGVQPATAPTVPTSIPAPHAQAVIKISGSGSTSSILNALKPTFETDTPGYRLEMLPGTETGGGVQGVIKGLLDVAAMARLPKAEESAQHVEYLELGKGAAAIFTHPEVGVTSLTKAQIVAIFAGKITNWSELGGPDLPIILFVRNDDDSATVALRKAVFGDAPFPQATVRVLTSQADMLVAVEGTPGSVGFGWWPAALARGTSVRATALDGVAPGAISYPIVGDVGIGYLTDRKADVQPLIDWLGSAPGQAALHKFELITTP